MIFEKIRGLICDQLDLDESAVEMESAIIEDLGADSLDVVDLIMGIEDEFGIEVSDEAVENIKTVGDVVRFLEENN